jgi:hypothetical protein
MGCLAFKLRGLVSVRDFIVLFYDGIKCPIVSEKTKRRDPSQRAGPIKESNKGTQPVATRISNSITY